MTVHVSAPTRLHFGLLHVPVPGTPLPHFGGLGAMLETPRVEVIAMPNESWEFEGSLAARARQFAEMIAAKLDSPPMRAIANGPAEHIGLGIGTALGMSIAAAMESCRVGTAHHSSRSDGGQCPPYKQLAGRGERSQIGVQGFASGGFLLDRGHGSDCQRLDFPDSWRFALINTSGEPWHGEKERAAFARSRSLKDAVATTEKLTEILQNRLIPALSERNFADFASALGDYNRIAGEPFAADQGGSYASRETARIIEELAAKGFPGAGQSSWGPTIFVPLASDADADPLASLARTIHVAKVAEIGSNISVECA